MRKLKEIFEEVVEIYHRRALSQEPVFTIFERLRKYKGARVTFKNLAAMKIFVGMDDNLIIVDSHVAKVLGINRREASKCRIRETRFISLLERCGEITDKLRERGLGNVSMVKWSLAIWFDKAKIPSSRLLSSNYSGNN